jgi:hypothetical protein
MSSVTFALGGRYFTGLISDFNIWSRPLENAEIENYAFECSDREFLQKADYIVWSEANIVYKGNITKILSIPPELLCQQLKTLNPDTVLIVPRPLTYDEMSKLCQILNSQMYLLKNDSETAEIFLNTKPSRCSNKYWVPNSLSEENAALQEFKSSSDIQQSQTQEMNHLYKCVSFDSKTKKYNLIDCSETLCAVCLIPKERLIFHVTGVSKSQCLIDTEYYLTSDTETVSLMGLYGRTQIQYNSEGWKIMNFISGSDLRYEVGVQNESHVLYPTGIQNWNVIQKCTDDLTHSISRKLKLSNVSY